MKTADTHVIICFGCVQAHGSLV